MSAPSAARAARVLLGEIGAAHGIRGEVVVRSFTADPAAITRYGALEAEDGTPLPRLTVVRDTGRGLLCRVAGVADRTAAEALRGTQLWIARDRLPPPAEGDYYHVDLIGLAAVAADGSAIGTIVTVANFGAGDLLEVRLVGGERTEYVPFTDACVPEVNVARGVLTIVMPATIEDERGAGAAVAEGDADGVDEGDHATDVPTPHDREPQ